MAHNPVVFSLAAYDIIAVREVRIVKPSEHINLVGILHVAWSLLLLVGACVLVIVVVAGGFFSGEEEVAYLVIPIATFASTLLCAIAIAGFIGAYGLLKRRNWGRFTLMVLSAFWLIKIPVGTALGIYSFWALTRDEVVEQFDRPATA